MSGLEGELWELAVMDCEAENILAGFTIRVKGGHAITKDEDNSDGAG